MAMTTDSLRIHTHRCPERTVRLDPSLRNWWRPPEDEGAPWPVEMWGPEVAEAIESVMQVGESAGAMKPGVVYLKPALVLADGYRLDLAAHFGDCPRVVRYTPPTLGDVLRHWRDETVRGLAPKWLKDALQEHGW
jgi:hypothetical protein